jgi:hypothetical protein
LQLLLHLLLPPLLPLQEVQVPMKQVGATKTHKDTDNFVTWR